MNESEHLLTCVNEECAEVAQIALRIVQATDKALRFGLDDGYPNTDRTNRSDLVREFNDLVGALEGLQAVGVELPGLFDRAAIDAKKTKIIHWMKHAEERGALDVSANVGVARPREVTNAEIEAWVIRHDLNNHLSTDVERKAAFDDAQSVALTKVNSTVP